MTTTIDLQKAYRDIEKLISDKEYVENVENYVKYYGCSDKQWKKRKISIIAKHAMREFLRTEFFKNLK